MLTHFVKVDLEGMGGESRPHTLLVGNSGMVIMKRALSVPSRAPVGPSRADGAPTGHDWAVVTDAHLWETGHCRRVTLPPPLDDLVFFFTEARAEDFVGGMATTTPPHKAQPRSLEPKGHEPLGKALASEITRYQEI